MKNKLSIVIIILILIAAIFVYKKYPNQDTALMPDFSTSEKLCFYDSSKNSRGFYDRAILRLDINGENVSGEYQNLPAEKDSKVGTFTGKVGALNQNISGRGITAWWNSEAEGMKVTEELLIEYGEGTALTFFGEMVDRGDGVYVYKDKNKLTGGRTMNQIECEDLEEILAVETYVKENIKNITKDDTVLGGSWYVTNIVVNPGANTGSVDFEDGHIARSGSFQYSYNVESKAVQIIDFRN
jgi:hypothetical protein